MSLPTLPARRTSLLAGLALLAGCGAGAPAPQPQAPAERARCPVPATARIDVLPGRSPNVLDAAAVEALDVAVLAGAGGAPVPALAADGARLEAVGRAGSVTGAEALAPEDVDGDGRADVVLRFAAARLREAGLLDVNTAFLVLHVAPAAGGEAWAGCDLLLPQGRAFVQLPAPTGPHRVGTLGVRLADAARPEPATAAPDDVREVPVRVWYPAVPAPRAQPTSYFLAPELGRGAARASGLPEGAFDSVVPSAVADAPLSPARERWPVLLFSPGLGLQATLYTGVLEELASHGWVVVALTHPYAEATAGGAPSLEPLLRTWVADARFVLDALERGAVPGPLAPLAAHLDVARVGALGHSFGGATAARLLQLDARVRAAMDMDGTLYGEPAAGADAPLLVLHAGLAPDATATRYLEALRGASGWAAGVEGAGHLSFSDVPLLPVPVQEGQVGVLGGPRALAVTRAFARDFFAHALAGGAPGVLAGPAQAGFPEAHLVAYPR